MKIPKFELGLNYKINNKKISQPQKIYYVIKNYGRSGLNYNEISEITRIGLKSVSSVLNSLEHQNLIYSKYQQRENGKEQKYYYVNTNIKEYPQKKGRGKGDSRKPKIIGGAELTQKTVYEAFRKLSQIKGYVSVKELGDYLYGNNKEAQIGNRLNSLSSVLSVFYYEYGIVDRTKKHVKNPNNPLRSLRIHHKLKTKYYNTRYEDLVISKQAQNEPKASQKKIGCVSGITSSPQESIRKHNTALQELSTYVNDLETENQELKEKVSKYENVINSLKNII